MHYDQDQEHGSGHESCENGGDDGDRMYNDTPRVAKTKYYRKLPPPKRGAHLTRLFRPELLLQSRTPLSSDEFSHFARHASEEERRTNTADIEALWNKLTLEIIPEFARDLDELHGDAIAFGDFSADQSRQLRRESLILMPGQKFQPGGNSLGGEPSPLGPPLSLRSKSLDGLVNNEIQKRLKL